MLATQEATSSIPVNETAKTKGQMYEGIAAGAAAIFYLLAHFHGHHETRCILKMPLLIAVFWGSIAAVSCYLLWSPPVGS